MRLNTTPLIVVRRDGTILAPWPGRWRTAVFLLDRAELLAMLEQEPGDAAA